MDFENNKLGVNATKTLEKLPKEVTLKLRKEHIGYEF
jgi:hypothetical protein